MASRIFSLYILAGFLLYSQSREKRIAPINPAQQQHFERQAKVAVLAGVGRYPFRSGLSQLQYPARDADLLEIELVKQGYKVVKLQDSEATSGSVIQALKDASNLVESGQGIVLFFFSGHGFAENGQNYLATFEATSPNLAATGLSIRRVEELLKATGAPRQVLLIDACRNQVTKSATARSFEKFQSAEGMAELFSTRMGSTSFENAQLGSGVFTHFLVRGLQGEAAGQDGFITFRDLADYITVGVSGYGFQSGQMQIPFEAGERKGDFLIAARAASPTTVNNPATRPFPQMAPVLNTVFAVPPGVKTKVNPRDGLPYVWIPPGEFTMGCSPGDSDCTDFEIPTSVVQIEHGFWIGQTDVPQAAYKQITGQNESEFRGDRLPIEQVTQAEARSYCQSVGMRLPNEKQWEYAARAGNPDRTYGPLDAIAWYSSNSEKKTHEVGLKQPNSFGLYDMLGNVREWVDEKDRLRGCSWICLPQFIRVSARYSDYKQNGGFRCVGD